MREMYGYIYIYIYISEFPWIGLVDGLMPLLPSLATLNKYTRHILYKNPAAGDNIYSKMINTYGVVFNNKMSIFINFQSTEDPWYYILYTNTVLYMPSQGCNIF